MIRKIRESDYPTYIAMSHAFYDSDAVLAPIGEDNLNTTFQAMIDDSPYLEGYFFEVDQQIAGYALLSFTHSNEAGGLVLLVEELYILPSYQGQGFGKELLVFLEEHYSDVVVRVRLEVAKSNKVAIQMYEKLGFSDLDYVQMIKEI